MMRIEDVTRWTAQQLHDEYQLREKLIPEMSGWLYPRVLRAEMKTIEESTMARFGVHPNQLIERGWTSELHATCKHCGCRLGIYLGDLEAHDTDCPNFPL